MTVNGAFIVFSPLCNFLITVTRPSLPFWSVMLLARTSRCRARGGGRSHLWRAEQLGDVQFQPGRRQPQRAGVEDARLDDAAAAAGVVDDDQAIGVEDENAYIRSLRTT